MRTHIEYGCVRDNAAARRGKTLADCRTVTHLAYAATVAPDMECFGDGRLPNNEEGVNPK
jgi:hypothetical protein